MSFLGQTEKCF